MLFVIAIFAEHFVIETLKQIEEGRPMSVLLLPYSYFDIKIKTI